MNVIYDNRHGAYHVVFLRSLRLYKKTKRAIRLYNLYLSVKKIVYLIIIYYQNQTLTEDNVMHIDC